MSADEDDAGLRALRNLVVMIVFAEALILFMLAYAAQPRLPVYEAPPEEVMPQ